MFGSPWKASIRAIVASKSGSWRKLAISWLMSTQSSTSMPLSERRSLHSSFVMKNEEVVSWSI
jgi:hypothetical protein